MKEHRGTSKHIWSFIKFHHISMYISSHFCWFLLTAPRGNLKLSVTQLQCPAKEATFETFWNYPVPGAMIFSTSEIDGHLHGKYGRFYRANCVFAADSLDSLDSLDFGTGWEARLFLPGAEANKKNKIVWHYTMNYWPINLEIDNVALNDAQWSIWPMYTNVSLYQKLHGMIIHGKLSSYCTQEQVSAMP